jgi:hypothetical protein
MDDRLARLKAELKAIAVWDEAYRLEITHDETAEVSYQARQERRREIMREIERLSERRQFH